MNDSGFVEETATETRESHRRRLDLEKEGGGGGEDPSGVVGARASSWHLPDAVVEEVPTARHGSPRQKGDVFGMGLQQGVWIGPDPLGQVEDVEVGGGAGRGGDVEAMDEGRGEEMESWPAGGTWGRDVDKTMEKGRFLEEVENGESGMESEDLELVKMEDVVLDFETEERGGRELEDGKEPYIKINSPDGWGKLPGRLLQDELCLGGEETVREILRGSRPRSPHISVPQSTLSGSEEGTEGGQDVVGNTTEEDQGVKGESKGVVDEDGAYCDKGRGASQDHADDAGTRGSHLVVNNRTHEGGTCTSTKTRRSTSVDDDRGGKETPPLARGPSMGVRNPKGTQSFCGDMVSLQGADHASCFLQRMKQLRHSEHLTDVLLRCDGGGILAHRLILTSYSEHLREILEGLPPGRRLAVSLPTVPLEGMEALLDYMYFGHAVLPRTHIPELRRVARELKVESLEMVLHGEDVGEQLGKDTGSTAVEVGAAEVTRSLRREEMDVEVTDELLVRSTTGNSDSEATAPSVLTSVVDSSSHRSLTTVTERPTSPAGPITLGKPALTASPSASLGALSIADSTCASSVVDSPDESCGADTGAPFSASDTTYLPFHSNKKSSLNVELTSISTCTTSSSSVLGNSPDGDLTDTFSSSAMLSPSSGISSSPDSEWSITPLTRTLVSPMADGHAGKYKLSSCTVDMLKQREIHGVLEDNKSSKFVAKTLSFDKIVQTELDSCNCSRGLIARVHTTTQTGDYRQTTLEAEPKPEVVYVTDSSLSVTSLDPLHSKSEKRIGNQSSQQTKKVKVDSGLQDYESQIERFTTDKCEDVSEESDLLDILPRTTEEEEIGILLSPEMKLINVASSSTAELGSYSVSEEDAGFYAKNLTDLEIEEESVSDGAKTENQVVQENFPEVQCVVRVNKREEEKIDVETHELPSLFGSTYRPNDYHHWPTGLITTSASQQPILNYGWNTVNQDPWHWFRVGKKQECFDDNSSHPSRWDELSLKYYDPEMKHLEQRSGLFEPHMYRCGHANNYIGALIGRHDPPMHMDFTPYLPGAQVPKHGIVQDAYGEDLPSSVLESQFDTKDVPENDHDQQSGGSRSSSHGDYTQPQKCEDMLFRETLWNCDQNMEESEMYKVGDNDTDNQSIHDLTDIAIQTFKVDETSQFSELREQSNVGAREHIQRRRGSRSLQKQHKRRLRSSKSDEPRRVSQRSRTMSLRALQWMVDKDLCKTPPKMKKPKKEADFESYDEKYWEIMPTLESPASKGRRSARGKKRQTPLRQSWPRAAKCDSFAMSMTQKGMFTLCPNELHEQAEASSNGPSKCQNSTPADDLKLSANTCITAVKSEIDTTKNAGVYLDDFRGLESNLAQKSNSPGFTSESYMSQAQGVHSWEECDKSCATGLPPLLTDFSKMDVVQWSQLHGLLAQEVACPSCRKQMPVQRREELRDGYTFRCHLERTGPKRHDCKRSIRSGSWFARSSLSIRHILQLTYMWSLGSSLSNVVRALKITSKSIIDWFCHCRAICEMATVYEGTLLGGEGVIVEIRECYLVSAKRKNGHLCNELYLLAGLDVSTGQCFLEKVQERDSDTLRAVLLRWVQFGSVVRSHCWETYDPEGSTAAHLASCRRIKREATDWSDAAVSHTSEYLDHFWRFSKRIILKGRRDHHHLLPGYLAEAMWRWEHRNESNIFLAFVKYIAKYFNPNECINGNRPSELRPQSSGVFGVVKPHTVS